MTAAVLGIWALVLCGVAVRWPHWLVPAAILCAPFEGAAIVAAGGVGVSPYFFVLILIVGRCVLLRTGPKEVLGRTPRVRLAMAWMAALAGIALAGALVLPRVFAGAAVLSPRLDADAAAPLSFSTSNLAQAAYLLLNLALLWYATQTGGGGVRAIVNATRAAGAIVVALAAYQFAAAYTGLPYPDDVLYSNTAYVMQHGSTIMDLPRLCSTFTEPTAMAVYLVGFLAFLAAEPPSRGAWAMVGRPALVVATIAVLALSTSTTAYLGLAGLAVWGVLRFVVWPLVAGRQRDPWTIVAVCALAAAVAVAFTASATLRDVVRETVFEKESSTSYNERSAADAFSTELIGSTWGLGVGLGSNRGSSFGPSLLSTVGVYGAAALAGGLFHLLRRPAPDIGAARPWHGALAAGLVGVVGTKLVSSPDLVTPTMWCLMASLLCVHGAIDPAGQTDLDGDFPQGLIEDGRALTP